MRDLISKHFKIIKFVISGGLATSVTVGTVFLLTDILKLWYLASTVIGFLLGVITSFFIQKFWTFEDRSKTRIKNQFVVFLLITIVNTFLYTLFVYFMVEVAGLGHLVAQFAGAAIIAIISFFTYQIFVFKK